MDYRKVFRNVKIKALMPANEYHIGYVAHDKTCGLKKCQGSTPLCHFRKSIFQMVSIVLVV